MSFDGSLIYLSNTNGNYVEFPTKYISAESYSVLLSGQDLDSARNANGDLLRNALSNPIPKIEFNTRNLLTNKEFAEMMSIIRNKYVNSTEKSIWVKAYIPEIDNYLAQKCYVPDFTPTIYIVDKSKKLIRYNSTRIAFIGYGKGIL